MTEATQDAIDLEKRRLKAISAGDLAALSDCLADDYLHVYGSGRTGGKQAYLEEITKNPREPTRGEPFVREYGDAVVITGDIVNHIKYSDGEPKTVHATVTQVAVKQTDGKWRFVSFQITQKSDTPLL